MEVKQFNGGRDNTLYVAVTLGKQKAGVRGINLPSVHTDGVLSTPRPATISIPEIVENINPSDGDFLKYLPDGMLNGEQLAAKRAALVKDEERIERMRG